MPRKQNTGKRKSEKITPEIAFGQILREKRIELGLKQTDLEEDEEIDRSYISKLELGRRQVCLRNFILISRKLNLTPLEMMDLVLKRSTGM